MNIPHLIQDTINHIHFDITPAVFLLKTCTGIIVKSPTYLNLSYLKFNAFSISRIKIQILLVSTNEYCFTFLSLKTLKQGSRH